MKSIGILSTFACAAVLTVACAGDTRNDSAIGDTDETSAVGTSGDVDEARAGGGDRGFVTEMLRGGEAEVQLGKLASDRAQHADVKQFGQMMVQDHTKAGEQLKQVAAQYNIQPETTALTDDQRDLMQKLSQLRGAEFDREYMSAMVEKHEDTVDTLQSRVDERNRTGVLTGQAERNTNVQPEDSDNPVEAGLNRWAADTLPVVQKHLEQAKNIHEKLEDADRNTTARR